MMAYTFKKVGGIPHVEYLTPGSDDILVISPEAGYKDSPERSRATVAFQQNYARALGKKMRAGCYHEQFAFTRCRIAQNLFRSDGPRTLLRRGDHSWQPAGARHRDIYSTAHESNCADEVGGNSRRWYYLAGKPPVGYRVNIFLHAHGAQ